MGRWILISTLSFPIIVLIIVGILFLVNPPAKTQPQAHNVSPKTEKQIIKRAAIHSIKKGNLTKVKQTIDSLFTVVSALRDSLKKRNLIVDSLHLKMSGLQKTNENLNKEIASWQKKYKLATGQQIKAKSIAKTLSALKVKDMGKILSKLDDDTVILIYSQMGNTARQNMMVALSSDRAAAITKKMLKN